MATITSTITLSGSGVTSDDLSITNTSVLDVKNPAIESASMSVSSIATTLVQGTATRTYLYVKNTGTGPQSPIIIETDAGINVIQLNSNEWCFLPVTPSLTLQVISALSTGTSTIEYSFFTSA